MVTSYLRPYAAKAIIEHEFDTDHLNIYVTFRFPMNQGDKPANAKWIALVDDIEEDITDSEWIDEYTMLLTVDGIASIPERVTLEYSGPDVNLTTTWDKQWEPWGAILSTDSALLPIGSYYGNEINWQQVLAVDTDYIISDADIAVGDIRNMTFQNNQEFKVKIAGLYSFVWYLSAEMTIANKHLLASTGKNGTMLLRGQNHHEFGRAGEESCIFGAGTVELAVDDLMSVVVKCGDVGNPTVTIQHVGLVVLKIADTS
ncbi:MAG: hypothetical protein E3J94_03650 [Desulfobacteraceae bacterium]|nr:MAG: hypothetical protein E3J94_03650 [Desulfobacteraceae bacterium]